MPRYVDKHGNKIAASIAAPNGVTLDGYKELMGDGDCISFDINFMDSKLNITVDDLKNLKVEKAAKFELQAAMADKHTRLENAHRSKLQENLTDEGLSIEESIKAAIAVKAEQAGLTSSEFLTASNQKEIERIVELASKAYVNEISGTALAAQFASDTMQTANDARKAATLRKELAHKAGV